MSPRPLTGAPARADTSDQSARSAVANASTVSGTLVMAMSGGAGDPPDPSTSPTPSPDARITTPTT